MSAIGTLARVPAATFELANVILTAPDAPIGQTPRDVVWTHRGTTLYRYRSDARQHPIPVLLVFALINRPDIFDLRPGSSFVEFLLGEGFDVFLVDWGVPDEEDADTGLAELVCDELHWAVRETLRAAGEEELTLLGWCIGGHAVRDVLRAASGRGGMAEYRLRLDPEGSAVLEAMLGPLAAPQPSTEHGSDTRTSDQRRADALVEVCRRAAAAGGSAPATAKAAVFVTMGYQDLVERTGAGTTLTGELLAPETVRGSPATPRSSRPSSAPGRGPRPRPDGAAGDTETGAGAVDPGPGAARSPAARGPHPGATPTTSGTGATAARPTCRTWPCSARGTTRSCTRRATPPPSPRPG